MELEITPGAAIKALTGMIVEPPEDWELGHPNMVHPYISWYSHPKGPEMAMKIVRIVGDVSLARAEIYGDFLGPRDHLSGDEHKKRIADYKGIIRSGNVASVHFVPDEAFGESWRMTEERLEYVARALWDYLEPRWADRDALALDPSSRQYRSTKMS